MPNFPGGEDKKSRLPLILGSLLGIIVVVGLVIAAFVLLRNDDSPSVSKADYEAGVAKIIKEMGFTSESGIDQKVIDEYTHCVADASYDKVSDTTREAMVKGDPSSQVEQKEYDIILNIANDCGKSVADSMMKK